MLLCAALLSCCTGAVFGFLYFTLYWPYRHIFNELGRHFDEQESVVYSQDSGVLIIPTIAFLTISLLLGIAWLIRRRSAIKASRGA